MSDENLSADALERLHQKRLERARQPKPPKTCQTCRFFGPETGDEEACCRRFPPFTHHPNRETYFPMVEPHWWCGEYQPRESAHIERRVYKDTDESKALLHARFGEGRDCYTSPFEFDGHRWSYRFTSFDDSGEYDVIWRPQDDAGPQPASEEA